MMQAPRSSCSPTQEQAQLITPTFSAWEQGELPVTYPNPTGLSLLLQVSAPLFGIFASTFCCCSGLHRAPAHPRHRAPGAHFSPYTDNTHETIFKSWLYRIPSRLYIKNKHPLTTCPHLALSLLNYFMVQGQARTQMRSLATALPQYRWHEVQTVLEGHLGQKLILQKTNLLFPLRWGLSKTFNTILSPSD